MLMGEFQHNIDKKGRVFIPTKLRADIGETFVVSRALDASPALFIYSMSEWNKLVEKIAERPFAKVAKLQRFFLANAMEMSCDAQGRICIPQNQRAYAKLQDVSEATIIGANNHIEIWNSEIWAEETESISQDEIMDLLEECEI
jgi:MraZ protein